MHMGRGYGGRLRTGGGQFVDRVPVGRSGCGWAARLTGAPVDAGRAEKEDVGLAVFLGDGLGLCVTVTVSSWVVVV